jgi:hypothetical protein
MTSGAASIAIRSTSEFLRVCVSANDAAMRQAGHARMASAETSRNSFSVAPLAA